MGARADAVDLIFGEFNTVWAANAPAPIPVIAWEDQVFDPPDTADSWVRVSVRHGDGDLITMGPVGSRVWRNDGVVIVQIFTRSGIGRENSDALAEVAILAFRGKSVGVSPCVRFRDIKPREIGPDGPWYQQNITTSFEYDETA